LVLVASFDVAASVGACHVGASEGVRSHCVGAASYCSGEGVASGECVGVGHMTERQMEIIEVVAVLVFIAVALWWGNSVGIERMG